VARELVRFAKSRPVLVLTHDLVLLSLLLGIAEKESVECTCSAIRRGSKTAGHISEGTPWDGQKVKQRLGVLKNALPILEKEAADRPEKYETEIRHFYGRLRDTWERAVEEVLLKNAVTRFAPQIKTQSLKGLQNVTETQLATLDMGMTRASSWVSGHDHAEALAATPPSPDEARADLAQLEKWVSEVRAAVS